MKIKFINNKDIFSAKFVHKVSGMGITDAKKFVNESNTEVEVLYPLPVSLIHLVKGPTSPSPVTVEVDINISRYYIRELKRKLLSLGFSEATFYKDGRVVV